MISKRWKIILAALPIIGTLAVAQPQPGGLGGFFQAWWGGLPTFNPLDINNITFWLDADDPETINLIAGTNRVSQWNDKSGFSRNATPPSTAARPYYEEGVINGRPSIYFDGSANFLNFTKITNTQPHAVAFVAKKIDTSIDIILSESTVRWIGTYFPGTGYNYYYDGTSYTDGNNSVPTNWNIIVMNINTNAIQYYINNNSVYTTASGPASAIFYQTLASSAAAGANYWKGYISEVVIYTNKILAANEINDLITYFNNKWSVF